MEKNIDQLTGMNLPMEEILIFCEDEFDYYVQYECALHVRREKWKKIREAYKDAGLPYPYEKEESMSLEEY